MNDERVLVTGGSGFIGGHCIAELIQAGYRVHTTIRSSAREADVRTMVAACGVVGRERLTFTVPARSPSGTPSTGTGPRKTGPCGPSCW